MEIRPIKSLCRIMIIAMGVGFGFLGVSHGAKTNSADTIWFQGSLPPGAQPQVNAANCWQEPWTWVTDNPKPFSGSAASQSTSLSGFHQHYFVNATKTITVDPGGSLVAYVYLDPNTPPTEVSVAWSDTAAPWDFKHRAFWGADSLASNDAVGAPDHYKAGDLPPTGQWVRLEVPASKVGLEGKVINGIALAQFDGKTTWDHIGYKSGDN